MIELGSSEHYLAIYQREVTDDTFQCALDLTYGDLHAWYEPVYFAREDVLRCMQETSGVIDGRRTVARLEAARPTAPGITLTLLPLMRRSGSADYRLRLDVEQARAGMLLEAEHVTMTLDVPHTGLLTAFREMCQVLPDALDTPLRPRLIDLGGIKVGGCLFHCTLRSIDHPRSPEDDVVGCLVDMQLENMSASRCEQAFFAADLARFAAEAESVARRDSNSASLRSLEGWFQLELVPQDLRREIQARVEMHELVSDYIGHHMDVLTGRYKIDADVVAEASHTIRALLRAEGLLEEWP